MEKDKETSIVKKIEFLKNYKEKYSSYITKIKNTEKIEDLTEEQKLIKCFFEEIDDKNLNDNQKKDLSNLLKQVIKLGNGSNIFYLLKEIKKIVDEYEDKYALKNDIVNIINFYKLCVEKDFKNFAILNECKCNYADVIKYVLCYGSCLNYNGGNKEGNKEEEMNVNYILEQLKLKENIEIEDKEFFKKTNSLKKDVINKLQNGFNQKFIIDLLGILPLGEYNEILKHGVNKDSVDYYFGNKMKDKQNPIKKGDIEPKTKAFYLLRYLEINKLFHIPKNILKINSLINENTNNKLEGKKKINKK